MVHYLPVQHITLNNYVKKVTHKINYINVKLVILQPLK